MTTPEQALLEIREIIFGVNWINNSSESGTRIRIANLCDQALAAIDAAGEARGEHVAYSENGVLHWMSGRKFANCELYTSPIIPSNQPAQPVAQDFDAWSKNPYTLIMQKSIAEDYVPRYRKVVQPVAPLPQGEQCPNTLGGAIGRMAGEGNLHPTHQQIFDAGVKSGMQRISQGEQCHSDIIAAAPAIPAGVMNGYPAALIALALSDALPAAEAVLILKAAFSRRPVATDAFEFIESLDEQDLYNELPPIPAQTEGKS